MKIDESVIKPIIETLCHDGYIEKIGTKYYIKKNFLFFQGEKSQSHFHNLYLNILQKHQWHANRNFSSDSSTFLLQIFSTKKTYLPEIKEKIIKSLNSIIQEYEDEDGDIITTLQMGQF